MQHIVRVIGLAIILVAYVLAPVHGDTRLAPDLLRPTGIKFEAFLASLPSDNALKAGLEKHNVTRVEPIFVFIPGILGSKLIAVSKDGKEENVWGCTRNAIRFQYSEKLSYDKAPKLLARPLLGPDSSDYDCADDVYEAFFKSMTYSAMRRENVFLNFAYDWRQSNRTSAQDLDTYLRENVDALEKQPVVFVAHSMGGLVFKWWYFMLYLPNKEQYPFDIAKVYFVGTPHNGSYATIDALKNGYTLFAKASTFVGWLERKIAPVLGKYGLTFPSFYELLPYETDKHFRAKFKPEAGYRGRESRVDLLVANSWRRLGFPNTDKIDLPLGFTLEQFYEKRLPSLLDSARAFHAELSNKPSIKSARYAFSIKHETPDGLIATDSGNHNTLDVEISNSENSGDGTVGFESAKDSLIKVSTDHMIWLNNEHSNLIVEENFIDRLLELRASIAVGWEQAAAQNLIEDGDVIGLLAQNGILLPSTGAKLAWTEPRKVQLNCSKPTPMMMQFCSTGNYFGAWSGIKSIKVSENDALNAIGRFNAEIVTQMAGLRGVSAESLTAQLYSSAKAAKNYRVKQELYQSYIAVEQHMLARRKGDLATFAWAHNNLGYSYLKGGTPKPAISPLTNAKEIARISEFEELYAKSARNLNVGVKSLGGWQSIEP